ncbi:MAG: hypothetical protein AAGB29_02525 [Planctomycetota bacterium]
MADTNAKPTASDPFEAQLDALIEQIAPVPDPAEDADVAPQAAEAEPTDDLAADTNPDAQPDAETTEDEAVADQLANAVVDEQIEQAIAEVEQAVGQPAPEPDTPQSAAAETDAPPPTTDDAENADAPADPGDAIDALGGQLDQLFAAAPKAAAKPMAKAAPKPEAADTTEPTTQPAASSALGAQLDALLSPAPADLLAAAAEPAEAIESPPEPTAETPARREVSIDDIDSLLADEAQDAAGLEFQPVEDVLAAAPEPAADDDASPAPDLPAADFAAPEDLDTAQFAAPDDVLAEAETPTAATPHDPAADFAAPDDLDDDPAATTAPVDPDDAFDDPDVPAADRGRFARYLHAADRALGPAAYAATHAGPHVRRALAAVNAPANRLPREMRETLGYVAIALAVPGAALFVFGLLT